MQRIRLGWMLAMSLLGAGVAAAQYETQLCWQLFSPPPGNAPFIDVIRCAIRENTQTQPRIYEAHCDDKGFFYHAGGAGTITQYDAIDGLPTVEFLIAVMFTRHTDDFFIGNANCGFTARITPPELNGPGAFQCSGGPGLPSNVEVFIKLKACPTATLTPPEHPPETEPTPSNDLAVRVNAFGKMMAVSPVEPATTAVGPIAPE